MKVIVEADGGSRGNPGPAGYGSVVWSADHSTVLAESKQAIGRATNNVAEYRGLIAGLEEAAKLGATEVEVLMDSKLVVEQMSGRWQVKHPDLDALHQAGEGRRRDGSTASATPGSRGPRTLTPTDWPTRRWTRPPNWSKPSPRQNRTSAEAPRLARRLDRRPRRAHPISVAAARADRIVHAAAVFRSWESGADRCRAPSGRGRRAVSRAARRYRGGHHVAAAARLRHRGEGCQGAWARRHRRRRPDRDGLRRVGGPDIR